MGVMVDLILIAILLAFMIIGYVRGLAGSLIKLASFAIAVVLALMLYKPISNVIMEKTQIDEKIETTLNTYSHLYPNKQAELADRLELENEEDEL